MSFNLKSIAGSLIKGLGGTAAIAVAQVLLHTTAQHAKAKAEGITDPTITFPAGSSISSDAKHVAAAAGAILVHHLGPQAIDAAQALLDHVVEATQGSSNTAQQQDTPSSTQT